MLERSWKVMYLYVPNADTRVMVLFLEIFYSREKHFQIKLMFFFFHH